MDVKLISCKSNLHRAQRSCEESNTELDHVTAECRTLKAELETCKERSHGLDKARRNAEDEQRKSCAESVTVLPSAFRQDHFFNSLVQQVEIDSVVRAELLQDAEEHDDLSNATSRKNAIAASSEELEGHIIALRRFAIQSGRNPTSRTC